MKVDVLDLQGKKVKEVELPASIFEAPVNIDLMHQAYSRQMANYRLGTHQTKTRHDVSGGGRKPWKQKGTGRARQGSTRSAQWVGGGKIHTPHPRDYSQKMPLQMRRAALRSALSVKAAESAIVVVDGLKVTEPKTKIMAQAFDKWIGSQSGILVLPSKENNENIILSTRNIGDVKVLYANYLNIRDLLSYDRVVFDLASLEVVSENLGTSTKE